MIVVRKPGEPTEEYQDEMANAGKSEFANRLASVEEKFEKHPVKGEDHFGDKHNMSLMKELLKTRDRNLGEIEKGTDNKTQKQVCPTLCPTLQNSTTSHTHTHLKHTHAHMKHNKTCSNTYNEQ